MKYLGMLIIACGIFLFWLIFFIITPAIIGVFPDAGAWNGALKIIIYVLIGYFGGIGIPIALISFGIYSMIVNK